MAHEIARIPLRTYLNRDYLCTPSPIIEMIFTYEEVTMSRDEKTERIGGNELYTPTKQEWLCTVLNQTFVMSFILIVDEMITTSYRPCPNDTDTIVINVIYSENSDRDTRKALMKTAKKIARETAKNFGWDTWLKIRVESEVFEE